MTTPRGSAKDALLAEALRLFAERGVEAVSIRDLAAATGFSNPALFRHFDGKEDLAAQLFASCYARLAQVLEAAAEGGLEAWLAAALAEIDRQPAAVLYVLDNLKRYWHSLPVELREANLPRLAIAMIERGQSSGALRADVAPPLVASVLFGALGQVARAVHFNETRLDPAAHAAALADLLGRGLFPRPSTPTEQP